ncbi:MAG: hypothetical protein JO360_03160, partial [Acidobacteria bacterium]|nr:hypothetical protein [Acidobacteriota bacterium]
LLEQGERLTRRKARSRGERAVEHLLLRHLRPEPRVSWGALLGEERLVTAMIDVSDGLSSDLAHLCAESSVGARLVAERIPFDPSLPDEPLSFALHGGEDFELLFTVNPRHLKRLPTVLDGVHITYIGDVTQAADGITLRRGDSLSLLRPAGFSHF